MIFVKVKVVDQFRHLSICQEREKAVCVYVCFFLFFYWQGFPYSIDVENNIEKNMIS